MPKFNEWNPSHEGKLCVTSIRIKLKGEVGMAGQESMHTRVVWIIHIRYI